jgi:hypothetical protein
MPEKVAIFDDMEKKIDALIRAKETELRKSVLMILRIVFD